MDGSRSAAVAPAAARSDTDVVRSLTEARERTLALVASVSDYDLERVHSSLMSPLVWDLGHIAAFEDLWLVHRLGCRPLLREGLAEIYDAFETPRAHRGELEVLGPEAAREYLAEVRERSLEVLAERGDEGNGAGPDSHGPLHVLDGRTLTELVLRHELQHNETMLQTLQLAQLEDYVPPIRERTTVRSSGDHGGGLDLLEISAGPCTVGAEATGFAYDNERPRHRTDVRGYLIGRTPITNATFLTFVEGGGYERREWWSAEGWAWKEDYDITRPAGWTADLAAEWRLSQLEPLVPDCPVVHVSWFEADAFARAHGLRLPTETEWEKAATWDRETQQARRTPWGEATIKPGTHANLDLVARGPRPVGAHPEGASGYGCLAMLGDVWEWTSTPFTGYPDFRAFPYREYSEVFFGSDYLTLRGGSWATSRRVATPTFRNWDYPQRRQIFAGFRVAKDLA